MPIVVLVVVAAAYVYVTAWLGAVPKGSPSFDLYAGHFPNVLYALDSVRSGHGLLWNSLQNCGQPFLPATLVGLLYPLHLVFLLVGVDTGFLVIAGLHLALAGGNAYWLCRECGIGRVAALCGGLTFMLGGATAALASWLPTTILGPYVWLPAAAAMTERILRRPNLRNALGLGACLTMSLLPGFPQVTLFTVQFIALRVLWELATYPASRRVGVLGWVALGGALPALFGAAFLLPALEFSARSVRSANLSPSEIALHGVVDWRGFAAGGGDLVNGFLPIFTLVPTVLAAFAFTRRTNWRLATFHVLVALLYLGLACSAALFALYAALPLGSLFRNPNRFLWMTSFAIVVPVALGADALLRARSVHRVRALGTALAGLALGVLVFAVVCRRPYVAMERWWLVALAGVAVAGAVRPTRHSGALALALPALLLANLFTFETGPFMRRLSDPGVIFRHQEAFAFVRSRITPFDRIHVLGVHDLAFMDKSASVSGLPAVTDYEPQTSRRFAEYSFWMFEARPMRSLNDFYYQLGRVPRMRPLFDLAAARWIVADPGAVPRNSFLATLPVRWRGDGVVVLENPDALPRAFWVPRLEVVAGPEAVLSRLATGPPRDHALIELLPADGFLGGADASATGQVDDFEDASEHLVVRMHATGEGFLVVSDQEYPGWSATVNGVAAPVLRANYVFRAVRVPAGGAQVEFHYRPRSVRDGTWLSLLSIGGAVAILLVRPRRRQYPPVPRASSKVSSDET